VGRDDGLEAINPLEVWIPPVLKRMPPVLKRIPPVLKKSLQSVENSTVRDFMPDYFQ